MTKIEEKKRKAMKFNDLCFKFQTLLVVSIFILPPSLGKGDDCVYTVYIRTGDVLGASTDAKIGLALFDGNGTTVEMRDLEAWGGLMGQNHDYFERGNLDIFSGRGDCLNGPACKMSLTSDGSGLLPGWYCSHLEVTTTGKNINCSKMFFEAEDWVGPPRSSFSLTKDYCKQDTERELGHGARDLDLDPDEGPVMNSSSSPGM
ncbi:PLAT domain-containing protein 3-like [Malania oleifera]|uniref:PLAT domain-containing protein 3-like n=1 Tax=Malania oleifera TaxID=397392 RepID=UPI0025ADF257|nr:PLAT domain-containing protein 3-like [Malania oleifera]